MRGMLLCVTGTPCPADAWSKGVGSMSTLSCSRAACCRSASRLLEYLRCVGASSTWYEGGGARRRLVEGRGASSSSSSSSVVSVHVCGHSYVINRKREPY
jgi:hypothetical protein